MKFCLKEGDGLWILRIVGFINVTKCLAESERKPGVRFSKDPKTLRARKAIRPAYSVKLVFSYVVKGIKVKITAKLGWHGTPSFWRYKDNYVTRSFGTFEKQAPDNEVHQNGTLRDTYLKRHAPTYLRVWIYLMNLSHTVISLDVPYSTICTPSFTRVWRDKQCVSWQIMWDSGKGDPGSRFHYIIYTWRISACWQAAACGQEPRT